MRSRRLTQGHVWGLQLPRRDLISVLRRRAHCDPGTVESMPRRWKALGKGAITWTWPGQSASELGRLVIAGGKPHRWPIPRAHRCVVEAFDIDRDAGIAAALIVTLPFRGAATAYQEAYEHDPARGWIPAGGASSSPADRALARTRPSAARSGPAVLIRDGGSSGGRSRLERLQIMEAGRGPEEMRTVDWINVSVIDVSVEVDRLLFSGRCIEVPDHGRCVVVWKSAAPTPTDQPARPRIAAVDHDGRILTELGPHDVLDTSTGRSSTSRSDPTPATHRRRDD